MVNQTSGGAALLIRLRRGRNPYEVQRLREEETKLPLKRRPTACLLTAVHADWDAHCRSTQADAIWLDSCMAAIHLDQTSKSK